MSISARRLPLSSSPTLEAAATIRRSRAAPAPFKVAFALALVPRTPPTLPSPAPQVQALPPNPPLHIGVLASPSHHRHAVVRALALQRSPVHIRAFASVELAGVVNYLQTLSLVGDLNALAYEPCAATISSGIRGITSSLCCTGTRLVTSLPSSLVCQVGVGRSFCILFSNFRLC